MKHYICEINFQKLHMKTKFRLNFKDKQYLKRFIKTGKEAAREIEHGYILLALDKGKPCKEIMDYYEVGRSTIWRVKNKYDNYGLEKALKNAPQSGQPIKYKENAEAKIVALATTSPPFNMTRWTLKLMTAELQKKRKLRTINRETIRLVLKKWNINLRKKIRYDSRKTNISC